MHMLHSSRSKSSARPATNRRNAMRHAEANAEWGALDFEQECHLWHHLGHGAFTAEWSCKHGVTEELCSEQIQQICQARPLETYVSP